MTSCHFGGWKHVTKKKLAEDRMASGVAIATSVAFLVLGLQNILFNSRSMVSEAKLMTERSASASFTLKVLYW